MLHPMHTDQPTPAPRLADHPSTWTIGRDAYQARLGVTRPHIAEISPVQYALMSKRARKVYDAKRHAEWDASAECANQYARECVEAFIADPAILDRSELHREARTAIIQAQLRSNEADAAARFEALRVDNAIESGADVAKGDRFFWLLGGRYLTATKSLRASVVGTDEGGREFKCQARACQWLKYDDLKAAAAEGLTSVRPARLAASS